ncbi:netrin receptor unc-40 isoform X2 [Microplitis mediator]|uniref:netrin receptor unc-40 isoform X2 n=1 Tax=Microplitis mediator TaxID=375433 RepID=UPI002553E21D|nr:netrin receptor unc-40 isoform X2 [Microplitis mediator]
MDKFIGVCLIFCALITSGHCAAGLDLIVEPKDVIVEPGGAARLDCQASSTVYDPSAINIQWRTEDGQMINFIGDSYRSQLANGSLYISSVYADNPELTGGYQCLVTVENVGAVVSQIATISLLSQLPIFDEEPRDIAVSLGQTAFFSCSLLSTKLLADRVKIHWLKDEHPLQLDESRMTIMPSSGALEIDDVRNEDVGSYRCNATAFSQHRLSNKAQLSLEQESSSLSINFDEQSPPIFIAKPKPQIAVEGATIILECAANARPKPSILWLKDGVAVDLAALDSRYRKIAASSLMITDIMEEDTGSYQCRAKNDVETLDAVAEVTVQVPPRFIKRPEDKVASENQDLEFECDIYGKPEPKVTWLKNGEKITLSEYWQLVNNNNLRINGLLPIDAGIFQCIGTNPAGSVQTFARLVIIHKPKKIQLAKLTSTTLSPKLLPKKKLSRQRPLYNNTWQHPSTLLGHTLSAFTPSSPELSSNSYSGDESADLFFDKVTETETDPDDTLLPPPPPSQHHHHNHNHHHHQQKPESRFIDNTDNLDLIEGGAGSGPLLSAPRNLSVVIVSTRFVTLRWQKPENADSDSSLTYHIYYKQDGSQRERVVTTAHRQLEVVVRSLQPGVTYQFRVVAHNSQGIAGASSEVLTVTTHSEADVPSPPLNLEGHATSSQSIKVSWQEPKILNGRISKYVVTLETTDDASSSSGAGVFSEVEKIRETTITTCELVDLTPYTEYSISVYAVNENGPGPSTGEINIRTFSAQPSHPPHNVTLEAASSTSIIVRWEPPLEGQNGIITGYKIRYRRQDRRYHSNTITTEGNKRLHVISGLEKHGVYHVRICALNVNGTGPWTEWMAIETYENDLDESTVPSAPTNLRTKPLSTSISVWWSPPRDDKIKVRGYIISWGKGYPDVFNHELDGKQRYYSIESLDPMSEYVISLRASNEAGEGPPIYANVRTTEKTAVESTVTPLIPPVGLKAIVLSASTVVLYWTDTSLSKSQYVTDHRYYVVRYAPYHPLTLSPRYKYFNATDLNCMIDDLKPNTQYEFTVKTVKGKRESPWSMIVLNQTHEAAPTSSPRDLTVQSYEDRSTAVIVHWQPPKQPNGHIIGYIISYSTDNTKRERDWHVEGVLGNKTEYIIKGLKPSTTYYFKIQGRNAKGYGPFSSVVVFKTPQNGRGLSQSLIYIIVGCSVVLITGVAVVVVFVCCRRQNDSPDRKKGYMKDVNQKTNIKPPDLWIHHDQMELKALEKSSINGETLTSTTSGGIVNNTLPRSGNTDYNHTDTSGNAVINSGSLDKRTYVPSYMATNNLDDKCSTLTRQHSRNKSKFIPLTVVDSGGPLHSSIASATAASTAIVNSSHGNSLSQPTIYNSSDASREPSRSIYPRTVGAQYSLSRAHITLEPTPESNPSVDLSSMSSNYEQLHHNSMTYGSTPYNNSTSSQQFTPGHYVAGSTSQSSVAANSSSVISGGNSSRGELTGSGSGTDSANANSAGGGSGSIKRLQGHPLKSFSVPAPPPQSAPSTPAQQKHVTQVSQVTVRSSLSGSPYKKQPSGSSSAVANTNQLTKNRLASVSNACHTPEEIERLKPSYSTEELNQEMANLEGLMKDLNAITASEFEC